MGHFDAGNDNLLGAAEKEVAGWLFRGMAAPIRMSSKDWAAEYRVLTTDVSPIPGRYDPMVTPYMLLPMKMLDDPTVPLVVARKSAQIAWTEIVNNYIGKRIHLDPCNILVAFPSGNSATSFSSEKLKPFIKNTPELLEKTGDPERYAWNRLRYPGGFIKLLSAASISSLKSTNASTVIIEEPDDLAANVGDQGDALVILTERLKAHPDAKLVYGGTPTVLEGSKIEEAYSSSCQYEFQCICHSCGEFHVLDFSNMICDSYPEHNYSVQFGKDDIETARYECPHCHEVWTDAQKNKNVLESVNYHELGWKKARPEVKKVGFSFNELLSPFAGSTFRILAEKRAVAWVDYAKGKEGKLKSWVNNSEGRAYSAPNTDLSVEKIRAKALAYQLGAVPKGGIVLTAGVDIQHNRFHIVIRAWGANKNLWLVQRIEIFGNVKDYRDPVWGALKNLLMSTFPVEGCPARLGISAVSIDTSDGNTVDLAYSFVLKMNELGIRTMACKGSSEVSGNVEIFTQPKTKLNTDSGINKSLAETYGVTVYMVGSTRVKELLLRKLGNSGDSDRLYTPMDLVPDWYDQMLSNVKVTNGKKVKYELISGKRDEDLDCEGLAYHAGLSLYLHLRSDAEYELQDAILRGTHEPKKREPKAHQVTVTKGLGLHE